jgi:hypothetical protein
MTQDSKNNEVRYESVYTIHGKKIKDTNKTLNYITFERKEEI